MKTAIIIGAASGIGREVAARLVGEGWRVGITGRRTEALEAFPHCHLHLEHHPALHLGARHLDPELTPTHIAVGRYPFRI